MKENEIRFLVGLDPDRLSGTIQELLMRPNILNMPYHKALEYLVKQTLEEKKALGSFRSCDPCLDLRGSVFRFLSCVFRLTIQNHVSSCT